MEAEFESFLLKICSHNYIVLLRHKREMLINERSRSHTKEMVPPRFMYRRYAAICNSLGAGY